MVIELSNYQKDVIYLYEAHAGSQANLVINACAGSGKTATSKFLFDARADGKTAVYIAFNKDIKEAVKPSLSKLGVAAETYHSHGFRAVRNTYGGAVMDSNKILNWVGADPKFKFLKWKVKKLVSLCKMAGVITPDNDLLEWLSDEYDVDFEDKQGIVNTQQRDMCFQKAREAILYSIDNPTVVDFDDMIFLPHVLPEIQMPQYDLVVLDELQDTNKVQAELALRTARENTIGIGDRKQAIYAFRGAGSTSVDDFKGIAEAHELPLSLCYRCPTSVRDLVNRKFPSIKFETPPWAEKGLVEDMSESRSINEMQPGDLVLCRVNADLIQTAFDLIRAGKRAHVKGRDIGSGIKALIIKSNAGTTKEFLDWASGWLDRELEKAAMREDEAKRQRALDRHDTILVIAEGTKYINEIEMRCDALFVDDDDNSQDGSSVTLSTIHKAKGLEADNVFIIRPDLLPHPAAGNLLILNKRKTLSTLLSPGQKGLSALCGDLTGSSQARRNYLSRLRSSCR